MRQRALVVVAMAVHATACSRQPVEIPTTVIVRETVEVTRQVEVTELVEITQEVEVTRVVEVPVTVTPTATPLYTPTITLTPSETPIPSETPVPTATLPRGVFFQGTFAGNAITENYTWRACTKAVWSYSATGSSNVIVYLWKVGQSDYYGLIVNDIAPASGQSLEPIEAGNYYLEIDAYAAQLTLTGTCQD